MSFPFATSPPDFLIETSRLGLTTADPKSDFDCHVWLEFQRQPVFVRNLNDVPQMQIETVREALTSRRRQYDKLGFGNHVVWLKPEGPGNNFQAIGVVTMVQDENAQYPDVGFALYDAFHGKGYASEAASALIEYVEQMCNVSVIFGYTSAANTKSRAVFDRIGMRLATVVTYTVEEKQLETAAYVKGEGWEVAGLQEAIEQRMENLSKLQKPQYKGDIDIHEDERVASQARAP